MEIMASKYKIQKKNLGKPPIWPRKSATKKKKKKKKKNQKSDQKRPFS